MLNVLTERVLVFINGIMQRRRWEERGCVHLISADHHAELSDRDNLYHKLTVSSERI